MVAKHKKLSIAQSRDMIISDDLIATGLNATGTRHKAMKNLESFLAKFQKLSVFTKKGQRAPHKPLLLLYALAKLQRDQQKFITFNDAEKDVAPLIEMYRPWSNASSTVSYPYNRLANDMKDIWWFEDKPNLLGPGGDLRVTEARSLNIKAGFTHDTIKIFEQNPHLIENVATLLLSHHFADGLHEEILEAVGLEIGSDTTSLVPKKNRNPEFRREVINAYFEQCCFCDFDMKLNGRGIALEAAHIQWHAANGPDQVINGLALCVLHHRLFDFGALTVLSDHTIHVSENIAGNWARKLTSELQNKKIRPPRKTEYSPAGEYLKWHHEQVFKGKIGERHA